MGKKFKSVEEMIVDMEIERRKKGFLKNLIFDVIVIFENLIDFPGNLYRNIKWFLQRRIKGWDERHTWSVDYNFAKFMSDLLSKRSDFYFINLVKIKNTFYIYKEGQFNCNKNVEKYDEMIKEGFDLFKKAVVNGKFDFIKNDIAKYIIPVLEEFNHVKSGLPIIFTNKKFNRLEVNLDENKNEEEYNELFNKFKCVWTNIINSMINAFKLWEQKEVVNMNEKELILFYKGIRRFVQYYSNIWW